MESTFSLLDYQKALINFVTRSLKERNCAAIEAPTGSGKTIVGLMSALEHALANEKKILYLTRTNSQQEQVIRELRKISEKHKIQAVPLQGRQNLCILHRKIEDADQFSAESLSRFCTYRKKKVMSGNQDACEYYNPRIRDPEVQRHIFESIPTAEEIYEYGEASTLCPYESLKYALKRADIVIAPYASFISPVMADRLLYNWGITRDKLVIVLDEAHNLPFIARETSSFEISVNQINLAEKEAYEFGDNELTERVRATDFTEMLRNAIISMVKEMLNDSEEIRVRFEEFREFMMIQNHISSERFKTLSNYLEFFGEYISETREKDGKIPRSHVLSLAWNLLRWESLDSENYVSILSKNKDGSLYALSLEPSEILEPMRMSSTIHMSGTLQPISAYKNITGFSEMPQKIIRDIFPKENKLVVYSDEITTKFSEFDDTEAARMHDIIERIVSDVRRSTIVFFPSYNSMDSVSRNGFSFPVLRESRGMSQMEFQHLIRDFRKETSTILAVSGGRISEGVNFPGSQLELVIIAGIPYPKPDARQKSILEYYEFKFHNGWEYAVSFPTAVKIRQEIGRLIRDRKDRGMAIILDKRAVHFRKYIPEMKLTKDVLGDALTFFSSVE